jgi:hypothetical protein
LKVVAAKILQRGLASLDRCHLALCFRYNNGLY